NLPVTSEDSAQQGWTRNKILRVLFQSLQSVAGGNLVSHEALEKAYQIAMAPNPWEAGRYNIPSDEPADPFVKFFDEFDYHVFWAPVFSPEDVEIAELQDKISEALDQGLTGSEAAGGEAGQAARPDALRETLAQAMQKYLISDLNQAGGEDGETFNVARLRNPFRTRATGAGEVTQPIGLD